MTSAEQLSAAEHHDGEVANSLHIYLPGIMGTNQGMEAIYAEVEQAITEHYPGATFEGKNSYISPDTLKLPDKDRHILLARKIVEALKENRDIHLYGHSLGAVELARVMFLVRKLRPDLKPDHPDLQRLHLVLMSPAGFGKNVRQSVEMLSRMKNILMAGSELSGHIYGLETLAYIPLKAQGVGKNDATFFSPNEQAGLITRFYHQYSQRGEFGGSSSANEVPGVVQTPIPEVVAKRFARLSDDEKQKLYEIDDFIHIHAARGDREAVQADLVRRGKLLSKYAQETYNGLPAENTKEEVEEADQTTWQLYAQALLGSGRLLASILRGSTYSELKPLMDAGVDITFLVPEYDALVKMREIEEFLGDVDPEERTILLKTTTHSSSSLAPRMLAQALQRLKQKVN